MEICISPGEFVICAGFFEEFLLKPTPLEEIDFDYQDPALDPREVRYYDWESWFASIEEEPNEFPIHFRRERMNRTSNTPHHHNDFLALFVVRRGRGARIVNGRAFSLVRGDVFLMPAQNTHSFLDPRELVLDAVYFHPSLWSGQEWVGLGELPGLQPFLVPGLEGFAARGGTDHFGRLSPGIHADVETTLEAIRRELKLRSLPLQLSGRARFFALLVQLARWRATKTMATEPARGAAIADVLRFCDENFQRRITTDQLAAMMHFSRANFFEVFTREVGMPPAAYVRRLRVQHAQKLLEDKSLPIADIAQLCGFTNPTHLWRAFKQGLGVSPLEFRLSTRSGAAPAKRAPGKKS